MYLRSLKGYRTFIYGAEGAFANFLLDEKALVDQHVERWVFKKVCLILVQFVHHHYNYSSSSHVL